MSYLIIFMLLDERLSSTVSAVPSLAGKKLSLPPPPVKKPQRVASSSLISTPLTKCDSFTDQRLTPDVVDGAGHSRPVQKTSPQGLMAFDSGERSAMLTHPTATMEFDSVERSAMLTHPTATRVKAPRRRLPSTVYNKEVVSVEVLILKLGTQYENPNL
jgi:hypothetical protein